LRGGYAPSSEWRINVSEQLKGGQSPKNEESRIFANVYGVSGAGKTAFALTFPPPFFILNLDKDMRELLMQLPDSYDVEYERLVFEVDGLTAGSAAQYLVKADALLKKALLAGEGTFLLDGGDIFWDTVKIAKLMKGGDGVLPKDYSPANAYMNSYLSRLQHAPFHVCMTSMSRKKWEGAKKESDKMEADGFKHRKRWVSHEIYMFTPEQRQYPSEVPAQAGTGQTHKAYIDTSKINESLVGSVIPNLTFKVLYAMTYGSLPDEYKKLWSPSS
jgi:hypothetical protein